MNFNSDSIELFLAVIERGSFSAAARALGRVPSAVSMSIGNLEAELGYLLFDRSHREPKPTAMALSLDFLALPLLGIRLEVDGLERLPEGSCVVIANHSSYLDGVVMTAALPPRDTLHVRFFSDHHSDAPMFEWADEGFAINPTPKLRALAAARGRLDPASGRAAAR